MFFPNYTDLFSLVTILNIYFQKLPEPNKQLLVWSLVLEMGHINLSQATMTEYYLLIKIYIYFYTGI